MTGTADASAALDDGGLELPAWSGPLAGAVAAATGVLREVVEASRHLVSLSVPDHVAALEGLAVVQRLADAATFAVADSLAGRERSELVPAGATSVADVLARATGTSSATARRQLSLAASARADRSAGDLGDATSPALPALGAVLAEGRISTQVLALAVTTVRALPTRLRRLHLPALDQLLAENLPGLTFAEAEALCARLLDRIDPDRADRGFDPEDFEKRRLRITRHDDGWVGLSGLLDPASGAQLIAGVDHYSRPAPPVQAEVADAEVEGGGSSVTVRDSRNLDQRRADALGLIARQGVTNSETRGGEPPRVIITATQAQVEGQPRAGRAVCEQTGPVPRSVLGSVLSRAVIQAVVLSGDGPGAAVLSLGRGVRCFTAAQRRAMFARDGGCVFGCDAPLAWLEAHHVTDWAEGGPTDVDDGVLACPHHHLLTTLGVWEVRMADGAPQIRPPASIDPLRRWLRSPRRALRSRADAVGDQLLLGLADPPGHRSDQPHGWRYVDPPGAVA